jgi:hypothetical protein
MRVIDLSSGNVHAVGSILHDDTIAAWEDSRGVIHIDDSTSCIDVIVLGGHTILSFDSPWVVKDLGDGVVYVN